jgi:FdhD protein
MGSDEGGDAIGKSSRVSLPVIACNGTDASRIDNCVIVEEPLEIYVDNDLVYTTMRSPGEEMLLAVGYCFTEGLINSVNDVLRIDYCDKEAKDRINLCLSAKRKNDGIHSTERRHAIAYSSCGICGSMMDWDVQVSTVKAGKTLTLKASEISKLQRIMEDRQEDFPLTGGAHAAAIFDGDGNLLAFSEDVGRHNALDKAIGSLVLGRKTGEPLIVLLTSRLSFEMVRKAIRLGAEFLVAISSATSLAVELAGSAGITLVGFWRKGGGSIYTCPERVLCNE